MKVYMLTWQAWLNNKSFDRQTLLNALDRMPEVLNWRAAIGAAFIVSEASQEQLTDSLMKQIPDLRFVFAQIDMGNIQGWADKETWDFITNPKKVRH
jgi:hypothetical protein